MTNLQKLRVGDSFSKLRIRVMRGTAYDAAGKANCSLKDGVYVGDGTLQNEGLVFENVEEIPLTKDAIFALFPSSNRDTDAMVSELEEVFEASGPDAKSFFEGVRNDPLFEAFTLSPAAMFNHHAYVSGLLEHTLSMARMGRFLSAHYNAQHDTLIQTDIVVCGVLMHDFCKAVELSFGPRIDYTVPGRLIGHVVLGYSKVEEICDQQSLSSEFKMALSHAVLSHHGKKEYGAPVEPHTPEAVLLHQIDMMDSRMNMVSQLVSDGSDQDGWSDYSRALGARMYLGDRDEHS